MSMHILNLLQTKLYALLIFRAIYFSGASINHGAAIYYAYFRWQCLFVQ